MPIFTRYRLSGKVVESRFIDSDEITQHKYSILGQKARITTNDGKVYEGFADEPYHTGEGNSLTLMWYDTDYRTGHLRLKQSYAVIHVGAFHHLMNFCLVVR